MPCFPYGRVATPTPLRKNGRAQALWHRPEAFPPKTAAPGPEPALSRGSFRAHCCEKRTRAIRGDRYAAGVTCVCQQSPRNGRRPQQLIVIVRTPPGEKVGHARTPGPVLRRLLFSSPEQGSSGRPAPRPQLWWGPAGGIAASSPAPNALPSPPSLLGLPVLRSDRRGARETACCACTLFLCSFFVSALDSIF